jgi:hypothetical protein
MARNVVQFQKGLSEPEFDDAYLGGERHGGKRGRGAPGKTPFIAAVETTAAGKPVRLKLRRVTSFCAASIAGFAKRSLDPSCSVVSDGLWLLRRRHRGWVHPPGRQDRLRAQGGTHAGLQMGQYGVWQHQGCHHGNVSRDQQQARPALPRRIRIPLTWGNASQWVCFRVTQATLLFFASVSEA